MPRLSSLSPTACLGLVVALALLARLVAWRLGLAPVLPDADTYLRAGMTLLQTGKSSVPYTMPVYPIVSYALGGGNMLIAFDVVISVVTVPVIYGIAQGLFANHRASLIAAGISAVYPHFVFYSLSRLTETLYLFLLLLAFLLFYRRRFAWGSFVVVLSILVRPAIDLLGPVIVLVFAKLVHGLDMRTSLRHVGKYLLIYVAVMSPWWLHNYSAYGQFVRLNLAYGEVLYAGNNPMNRSGGGIVGVDYSRELVAGINDPVVENRVFAAAAIRYIADDKPGFVERSIQKALRFWRPWPYAKEYSSWKTIAASIASFGTVLFFALIFVLKMRRDQAARLAPILLFALYLTLVHMVTIGSIRYRLPIEPFLIILAGQMIARLTAPAASRGQADQTASPP